jgi:hypothetical protein
MAVRDAMQHCTKQYAESMEAYMKSLTKDSEADKAAGEKRIAKYDKMLADQKLQCGPEQP